MKKIFLPVWLLVSSLVFFECKKDYSCHNCNRNNSHVDENKHPIANAGIDQLIVLPDDSVILNGNGSTDPDQNISSYLWTKISGPGLSVITNPNAVQTTAKFLTPGNYQFALKVTDAGGLYSTDTINIRVDHSPGEAIINNLTWQYWHDANDPPGMFDEVALFLLDSTNILLSPSLNVLVKTESSTIWSVAHTIVNGNCMPPYSYYIVPTASADTSALIVSECSLNLNLVGTKASVKIIY